MGQQRGQVLIVDDEVFFLEAIDEILIGAGFETMKAEDGASALAAVADPTIGAVVLDVRLPDMDGIQVLACIRERRPELPIIMLSASTDQEIVLEALRLGAGDYLAKPLHEEELALAVGRALDGFEANASRKRLRQRIDRLVEGMERLSQIVRLASPKERVEVLRQGIVDSASVVLQASRASLMLADAEGEWLSVVASRGVDVGRETMSARKVGEGASGLCFAEGQVICVPEADADDRFAGRGAGRYHGDAFAVVPLVCLGVPVGVLCLTEVEGEDGLSEEDASLLRLLGMQISEFLAADPEVEELLRKASVADVEGVASSSELDRVIDGDAELARVVCEAIAEEVEPDRLMQSALRAVCERLDAAPASLYLVDPESGDLLREAEWDGGVGQDHERLGPDRGLVGQAWQSGRLVATDEPAADGRFLADADTATDGVVRPSLFVPLKLRGRPVGLLRIFLEPGRSASPRTGEILGASFAAALRNVLLYRSLLQSIEEVADARRQARA